MSSQLLARQPPCTLLCWRNLGRYCSQGSAGFFRHADYRPPPKRYKTHHSLLRKSWQSYKNSKANRCVDCGFWTNSMEWGLNFKWPCEGKKKKKEQMERYFVLSEVIQPYTLQARTPSDHSNMKTMDFVQFFQWLMHLNEWLGNYNFFYQQ